MITKIALFVLLSFAVLLLFAIGRLLAKILVVLTKLLDVTISQIKTKGRF